MVHALYWVSALVYALVLGIILIHEIRQSRKPGPLEKAFRTMIGWVIFFCLQDAVWGLCAGERVHSDTALFLSSTVFHASTVLTTMFWLRYVLTYLSEKIAHPERLLMLDGAAVTLQLVLLVVNFFTPTIFTVENGEYTVAFLRPLAFWNQYCVYFLIGIAVLVAMFRAEGEWRRKCLTVFVFTLAPILTGVFQLLYPNGPFYSVGYFLGCFIVHIFVVSWDREQLDRLNHEKTMAEQILLSNTDKLTGLLNRRAYEDDLVTYPTVPTEPDFVYVSADVNGLKTVNDLLGHAAGDELLRGAASCIQRCLGSYGRVYRLGGDEFAAIIFTGEEQLKFIQKDLEDSTSRWHGEVLRELSISFGFAEKRTYQTLTVPEMARIADAQMYRNKEEYYRNKGLDRRGQSTALSALFNSYTKILRVNLTEDSYQIIRMDVAEQVRDKGFSEKISTWLHDFGTSGQVYPDDLETYLAKTEIGFLRSYFRSQKTSHNIFYRRLIGTAYRQAKMEMIPTEAYSDDCQELYLYVKDIDR